MMSAVSVQLVPLPCHSDPTRAFSPNINPIPLTPVLGSSISAANTDMMSKKWTNGGKIF